MKAHGEKYTRHNERAIAPLLQAPTILQAAGQVGVSESTLIRWMHDPVFAEEYRAARRQVVENALAQLQQATGEAAATLRRNLTSGVASVEVRAAMAILDFALKALEWADLESRIARLEAEGEAREEAPCA